MVHGWGCNPHCCTTTFANVEITSLWRHWWRHNSETIRDTQKQIPPRDVKSSELSNDENRKTGNYVIYDVIIWVQDGNCKKWLERKFSIGVFYNITKNQDNPIKTVGRDSFVEPKTPTNTSFYGSPSPQGSHSPYILGDTTRPRRITCVLVWSKSDQRRLRKTLHKQTEKQTDRQTDKQTLRK